MWFVIDNPLLHHDDNPPANVSIPVEAVELFRSKTGVNKAHETRRAAQSQKQ